MSREALQPWLRRLRSRRCRCLFFVCLAYQFFGRGTFAARLCFVACQLISKMPVKGNCPRGVLEARVGASSALIFLASFSVRGGIYRTMSLKFGCRLTGIAWSQVRFGFQPRPVDLLNFPLTFAWKVHSKQKLENGKRSRRKTTS